MEVKHFLIALELTMLQLIPVVHFLDLSLDHHARGFGLSDLSLELFKFYVVGVLGCLISLFLFRQIFAELFFIFQPGFIEFVQRIDHSLDGDGNFLLKNF